MQLTIKELAARLGLPYEGDGAIVVTGVASLDAAVAGRGDLVFMAAPPTAKLRAALEKAAASAAAAILPPGEPFDCLPVLRAANPQFAFVRATGIFHPPALPAPGVHPTAVVAPSARLGAGVSIGAHCVVGEGADIGEGTIVFPLVAIYPRVKVGAHCILHSHVSLREEVRLGDRVILHNGVVIGADGYGYLKGEDGRHVKIPQVGTVVIEDDVEIGANSTVDRAALGVTIVRRGTKIDDLVMVAHNVEIGENVLLVAQAGVAGSSTVGKNTIVSGQVGIPDHIDVGENVIIAAKTGVTNDIPSGSFVSGSPHLDVRVWRKFWAAAPRLYDLVKDFKRLQARVEELEKR
jgi:UDP-3-O-[3-hydroxymyristoyl] glucosamine N-acyltransferase